MSQEGAEMERKNPKGAPCCQHIEQCVPKVLSLGGKFSKMMPSASASEYLPLLEDDGLAPQKAEIPDSLDP